MDDRDTTEKIKLIENRRMYVRRYDDLVVTPADLHAQSKKSWRSSKGLANKPLVLLGPAMDALFFMSTGYIHVPGSYLPLFGLKPRRLEPKQLPKA